MSEDTLDGLKEIALSMGITHHPKISADKLRIKIDAAIEKEEADSETVVESEAMTLRRLRREGQKRVRVQITCMDANKKDLQGIPVSISNNLLGDLGVMYVPFNRPWHLPTAVLPTLQEKQHSVFYTVKVEGKDVKRSKLVNTYAIEVLDGITKEEVNAIRANQAKQTGEE